MPAKHEARDRWAGLAGRIDGSRHVLPIRVYHEDTDFTGLVYHANFLKFCERGRSDLVRLLGVSQSDMFSPGGGREAAAFVVRRMEIDFLKPARMDDMLEVVTTCEEVGRAALTLRQEVTRDGAVLARLKVQIVLVSTAGRVLRLPGPARAAFERFVNQEA